MLRTELKSLGWGSSAQCTSLGAAVCCAGLDGAHRWAWRCAAPELAACRAELDDLGLQAEPCRGRSHTSRMAFVNAGHASL